jgi:major membrane immunogen (membrane-anchored lipoprotein)
MLEKKEGKMIDKMKLGFLLATVLTLTACGDTSQTALNESSALVPNEVEVAMTETISTSIVLQEEGKVLSAISKDVKSEEGQNLLEVMKENYDVTVQDGLISAIESYEQNNKEGKYWMYTINGEEATIRAGDYILEDQDVIVWNLDDI